MQTLTRRVRATPLSLLVFVLIVLRASCIAENRSNTTQKLNPSVIILCYSRQTSGTNANENNSHTCGANFFVPLIFR